MYTGNGVAIGVALGAAFGAVLGTLTDEWWWIGVGIALGAGVGTGMERASGAKGDESQTGDSEEE